MKQEEKSKIKEILLQMDSSETNLQTFCEHLEKEFGAALTFTILKSFIDKHYSFISKSNQQN